ncbi:MAG: hypothetical protein WAS21_01795 [Geminicoccaceae bacterium]
MAVIDRCFSAMNGPSQPSVLAENAADSVSREQLAVAARLLRTISVTDGDVEILLHEMARALERIADADGRRCGTRTIPLAARYAWGIARI